MPDWQPAISGARRQLEAEEESGEPVCSDNDGGRAEWLCPLCQQGQPDRNSLSQHLTNQHNVLPTCLDKLLDIAVQKRCASGEDEDTDLQKAKDAATLEDLKHGEDSSSQPCRPDTESDAAQKPINKVMEEERDGTAEQARGGAQPGQEGSQPPKQQNAAAANVETQDANERRTDTNAAAVENNARPFKCNACLENFPTKTALSVHYTSASHVQRMTTGSSKQPGGDGAPSVPVLSRPYISNKPYQCATCRVSYNHAITLESHMKSVLHQTRSRNAGNATSSAVAAAGASGASGNGLPLHTAAVTTVAATNCAAPGNLLLTAKDLEHIQASAAVVPSLLSSPVASAQAVSAFLTLLTAGPNSLSHALLPSVFAAGAAPGAAVSQLLPQPHMLMPLILNGLQAQNQQRPDGQPTQLMPHCVPLLGLNAAQQALLAQRLCSLQNQWPAVGLQAAAHAPRLEERKEGAMGAEEQVKREESDTVQGKSSVKREVTDSWTAESCETEREEDGKGFAQGLKTETKTLKVAKVGDAGKADGDSTTDQLGLDGVDKAASLNLSPLAADKSFRNNNLSPSASVPSNCSLSPVNLNLTLSPDSTPQKSQAGTSPCGSLGTPRSPPPRSSSYKRALISPERRRTRVRHVSPGPPVLSDFQSEVLWAFFESRSEADAASPPREDCEALGREVGLHKDAVRRWLSHARLTKERQRALGLEHRHMAGDTRHTRVDNDYDEEESSLMIVEEEEDDEEDDDEEEEEEQEEEEDAEASSSQAMDLSSSRWKKREREVGRESQGDSCLTSDSENEEVYAAVVSDEESLNGSLREAPDSPVKEEVQRQPVGDKGLGGGKVLRSTTVFLSDAEDEDEEEEGAAGQRARRQKRKRAYEEVEIKKERQDPDVDLELEAQGDPPNTLALPINHPGLPSGILHSLPLSLSLGAFPAQFLSPYVLSLPPSMLADGSKLPPYPNPPNITRFPDPLCAQNLSSHGHASRYLSNGGDCESALDLSMGKNSHSKSASSSSSTSSSSLSLQKGRLLDGLGLRPTSKGLIVVQVKPEPGTTTPSNSSGMFNCNNMNKSSIYMRAAEKMNATLLEREKDKDKDQRKNKGKRYRDMRRSRTIIRAEQLDILYGCYFKDPNPGKHEFEQISEWVHLPKKVVQIWFQNMRARERKGEVRFISDGTLAAVGKPLIKFTWPLSKPLFSNKQSTNNTGSITATPIVRTLIKTEKDPVKEMGKPEVVKSLNKVPIKPKEVVPSTAVSLMSSNVSAVPKIKLENFTMVKIAPKINAPILPAPPKEPLPIAPRPTLKRKLEEESEEEKTDEEKDGEKEVTMGPGTINRMVPKLPTTPITPINNKSPVATAVSQKQNGLNYWAHKHKGPFKINTLSREQLALPAHTPPRTIPPPPTPSIAPVSPNTPVPVKALPPAPPPTTPALVKSIHTESSFLHHSTSRRPRTHLSCPQLSILQSCYETCAHPNAMECEAIGTELGLPLKVVQIWFQNTRAKEKRWRLQQEKVPPLSGEKVDMSSGSYLQYSALRANRPILPKPVQLTVIEPNAPPAAGQPAKELLTGRCKACNVTFESRAAARAHVFSPRHLATLRTTNFGQPATLVNKNGNGSSGAGAVSQVTPSSGGEAVAVASLPPPPSTTATSTS